MNLDGKGWRKVLGLVGALSATEAAEVAAKQTEPQSQQSIRRAGGGEPAGDVLIRSKTDLRPARENRDLLMQALEAHENRIDLDYGPQNQEKVRKIVAEYKKNRKVHEENINKVIQIEKDNPAYWYMLEHSDFGALSAEQRDRIGVANTLMEDIARKITEISDTPVLTKDGKEHYSAPTVKKMENLNQHFDAHVRVTSGDQLAFDASYARMIMHHMQAK